MDIKFRPLNKKSHIPLYYQIIEAVQYQIATGRIKRGERLPSIRDLAEHWQMNMHTVRHAYKELEKLGLIFLNGPKGTTVSGNAHAIEKTKRPESVKSYVQKLIVEARTNYNLSPAELIAGIKAEEELFVPIKPKIFFIECNESQINDHKKEIESIWDVAVIPMILPNLEDLPEGELLSTYFHFNEIRMRWPRQFHRVSFLTIRPDTAIRAQILKRYGSNKGLDIIICDQDEKKAPAIQADLEQIFLGEKFFLKTVIVKRAGELINKQNVDAPLLFTPRVWAQLNEKEKNNPQTFKVVYKIEAEELDSIGKEKQWIKKQ